MSGKARLHAEGDTERPHTLNLRFGGLKHIRTVFECLFSAGIQTPKSPSPSSQDLPTLGDHI
jgi:hypothetical protein